MAQLVMNIDSRRVVEEQSRSCRLGVVRECGAELGKAHGGCLGVTSRRRAWKAAKSFGEPSAGVDPEIPEWGNPLEVMFEYGHLNL